MTTQLGWQQVQLDETVVGVSWMLDDALNPGVILHNSSMVGKWSIASDEWYSGSMSTDYGPRLIINWE